VHPYHFKSTKKSVAVPKVHYEKIRLLKPDIIICNKENTQEIVERLSEICPVWVTISLPSKIISNDN
jgi:ABC-type Fe3+-hydroxamate transport system substrate-binding protein